MGGSDGTDGGDRRQLLGWRALATRRRRRLQPAASLPLPSRQLPNLAEGRGVSGGTGGGVSGGTLSCPSALLSCAAGHNDDDYRATTTALPRDDDDDYGRPRR
ncbi:hypothetical protein DAI22_11g103750 [Oryza sativa Japonica Group]|uniref:DUF834 domain-containing protein n=1 Tax=Oryza rufipogon TaxID=4529 RepID=A0A0E0R702_ORYRU|nr:hypothetical protein DAI22_11g103750 [Oryza sativa Japonica Group]